MLEFSPDTSAAASALLGPGDPPLFEVRNADGGAPLLLICDHASRAVPTSLNGLGLGEDTLGRHVAWDIGAADVTRRLSEHRGAMAVLAGYSRLLIDCNRQPGDPESIPEVSHGIAVPGNQGLKEEQQAARVDTFFWPYHQAITKALAHLWRRGGPPVLLSVHTFTPSLGGEDRYWDIGVLWNHDARLAQPLIGALRTHESLHVGDNQPYSGRDIAYSIDLHAGTAGLPNCAVEIRQDLVEDAAGAERWARILDDALENVLAREDLYRVEHF